MGKGQWWANSPMVILPLCAAALALAFVPFVVWNSDHAAQFYGSFIAALVAAGAVIASNAFQARLSRRQRLEVRHEQLMAEALDLYSWMMSLASDLQAIENILKHWAAGTQKMPIGLMRRMASPDLRSQLRLRIPVASRLPAPCGPKLSQVLFAADASLETLVYYSTFDSEVEIDLPSIDQKMHFAAFQGLSVRFARARLAEYLISHQVIENLDAMDILALQRGEKAIAAAAHKIPQVL